jgi:hypothetical protein
MWGLTSPGGGQDILLLGGFLLDSGDPKILWLPRWPSCGTVSDDTPALRAGRVRQALRPSVPAVFGASGAGGPPWTWRQRIFQKRPEWQP